MKALQEIPAGQCGFMMVDGPAYGQNGQGGQTLFLMVVSFKEQQVSVAAVAPPCETEQQSGGESGQQSGGQSGQQPGGQVGSLQQFKEAGALLSVGVCETAPADTLSKASNPISEKRTLPRTMHTSFGKGRDSNHRTLLRVFHQAQALIKQPHHAGVNDAVDDTLTLTPASQNP
jgi:hypothetical protein